MSFLLEHLKSMEVNSRLMIVSKFYRSAKYLASKLELNDNEWTWMHNLQTVQGRRNFVYTIYHDVPEGFYDLEDLIKIQDGKYINPNDLESIV